MGDYYGTASNECFSIIVQFSGAKLKVKHETPKYILPQYWMHFCYNPMNEYKELSAASIAGELTAALAQISFS